MFYRKKPVIIEAVQFVYTKEGVDELKKFCASSLGPISKARHPDAKAEAPIMTLEDGNVMKVQHIATEGDYIIKGVEGEFYACKPDIFLKTYEAADDVLIDREDADLPPVDDPRTDEDMNIMYG